VSRRRLDSGALAIATLFGAGRSPIAPGTAGTLVSLPAAVLAADLLPLWGFALVTAVIAAVAVWSADVAAGLLGSKDPGAVVIDETAGLFVALFGVPISVPSVAGAFVLFRAMDVLKPFPAGRLERLAGGWGIVADDLVAGIYANLALRLVGAYGLRLALQG
jgi:phosphatidylglycerophosphatase A